MHIRFVRWVGAAVIFAAIIASGCIGFVSTAAAQETTASFTSRLRIGSSGPQVIALQEILVQQGLLSVSPTGYFGYLTKQALEVLQATYGLEPVGSTGPLTRALLTRLSSSSAQTTTSNQASTTVPIPTPTPTPTALQLTADHTSVVAGTPMTLSWSSTGLYNCQATGAWSGSLSTSGNALEMPSQNSTYRITCTDGHALFSQAVSVTVGTAPAPTPTTTPTLPPVVTVNPPTTVPSGTTTSSGSVNTTSSNSGPTITGTLAGAAPIASTFDVNTALAPSWGTGQIPPINTPDVVGAFRFVCGAGQVLYDDPIVFPGQPGVSHLHQFYGNLSANANSTFSTLRTTGDSTCGSSNKGLTPGNAVNRSAYWMPAMLLGNQYVVKPDYVVIYYKRRPANDPKCSLTSGDPQAQGNCVPIPNGLRFIFGFDMVTNTAPTGGNAFQCVQGNNPVGAYSTLADLAKAGCPVGDKVETRISAPDCWDGTSLDSPNHRSHVTYGSYGSWGYLKCPADHPYVIPTFTLAAFYPVTTEVETSLQALAQEAASSSPTWDYTKILHLSSDEMRTTLPPGSTFHTDYFEAWDPIVKGMWTGGCINSFLNCSGGDLGNGKQIIGASQPYYNGVQSWSNPQPLAPIPSKTMAMAMPMHSMPAMAMATSRAPSGSGHLLAAAKPSAQPAQSAPVASTYAAAAQAIPAPQESGVLSNIGHALSTFFSLLGL